MAYTLVAITDKQDGTLKRVDQMIVNKLLHGDIIKLDTGEYARVIGEGNGRQRLWFIDNPWETGDEDDAWNTEEDYWHMLEQVEATQNDLLMAARYG